MFLWFTVRKLLQVFPATLNQNKLKQKAKQIKEKLQVSSPSRDKVMLIKTCHSCIEHLKLFMYDEIINQIITETNRYAAENRRPDIRLTDAT